MSKLDLDQIVPQAVEGSPKAKEYKDPNEGVKLDEELKALEIKAKKLELLEREANLQDVQERLGERQMKRENIRMRAVTNGATIQQINREKKAIQARCNHHKGGDGMQAVVGGQGQNPQFCVIKHTMANGDMWVICLRCGKHWKPVSRKNFKTDEDYLGVTAEYKAACQFQTLNQPSSAYMYKWSDGGELYRDAVANS